MKISIITVCLNSVETIERTIKSVIEQEYSNKEYIIIDGGSNDGTINIIERYEKDVAYWQSCKDDGIYDAMNQGIEKVTGDLICFLSSNDWFEENVLDEVIRAFEVTDKEMVCGRIAWIIDNQVMGYSPQKVEADDIYERMVYPHPALFVKKDVFNEYGKFDLNYKIAADYEWLLRLLVKGVGVQTINTVITNYSMGGISYSRKGFEESRSISLKYLPKERTEAYYNRIQDTYRTRVQLADFRESVNLVTKKGLRGAILDVLEKELGLKNNCSFFGCGIRAWECKNVLGALGIEVKRVYDNSKAKQGKYFTDLKIFGPLDILEGETIVITSINYEDEIKRQLDEMGHVRSICLSKVIEIVTGCLAVENM